MTDYIPICPALKNLCPLPKERIPLVYFDSIRHFCNEYQVNYNFYDYSGFSAVKIGENDIRVEFFYSTIFDSTYGKSYIVVHCDEDNTYYICRSIREAIRYVMGLITRGRVNRFFDLYLKVNESMQNREDLL